MRPRRAVVFGGNGFIGSHLVDQLIQRGWDVVVFDLRERPYEPSPSQVRFVQGDLSQSHLVTDALRSAEVVFHLAWATIHETSIRDPAADVEANLVPSIRLLESCRQAGVRRVVFVSSGGTVYGPATESPTPESHPQNPVSAYGINKLALEKYLHMFNHLYDLDYLVLRPSVPYGPRQNPLRRQGAISVFLYRIGRGLPVTIWGDGNATRDYFYIADLVEALIASAHQSSVESRILNIGGAEEVSLNRLVGLAEETVGKQAIVIYEAPRTFDAVRVALDTRLARQELDWQPKVPLSQGLTQTWTWISSAIV